MPTEPATLVTYETDRNKFSSLSERNKFYRGLFGYKQTVKENGKVYHYEKDGIIDEIPHIKVADSVFIIPKDQTDRLLSYLRDWAEKVTFTTYSIQIETADWPEHEPEQS
ncbi:MAG: hypothetical protein MUP66_03100 [Candidatus Nanohaloarchaeota archaeon QJJ-5]|nr:hypothetical protein [Candidatus Nanohaloarchaeota archaeon QJJ-5]